MVIPYYHVINYQMHFCQVDLFIISLWKWFFASKHIHWNYEFFFILIPFLPPLYYKNGICPYRPTQVIWQALFEFSPFLIFSPWASVWYWKINHLWCQNWHFITVPGWSCHPTCQISTGVCINGPLKEKNRLHVKMNKSIDSSFSS